MNIFLIHFSPQDDKVLTDPTEVVNVMNDFYINIVNQIGYDSNMPSLKDYCISDFIKRCCDYHASHLSVQNNFKYLWEPKF